MSTRSGRRIHSSIHENTVTAEAAPAPRSERKRPKRQENEATVPRATTKRVSYVAYPAVSTSTDEEHGNDDVVAPSKAKTAKKTQRNALKELNLDLPVILDNQQVIELSKIPRVTRQTKKFLQNVMEEPTEAANGHRDVTKEYDLPNSRNKKSKKKKSKKGNSEENASSDDSVIPVQEQVTAPPEIPKNKKPPKIGKIKSEEHNTGMLSSIESYYTAVGSPPQLLQEEDTDTDCKTLNGTFDKTHNETFEKPVDLEDTSLNGSIKKQKSIRKVLAIVDVQDECVESPMNITFEKQPDTSKLNKSKLNNTFDKTDNILNTTFDKADQSRVSITSDEDSGAEHIVNTTPVLVESSIDDVTPTPLARESTFTKESPQSDEHATPLSNISMTSTSAPGSTPFHTSRCSSRVSHRDRSTLNVTRSIEKPMRNSTSEPFASETRHTRVMFCSPTPTGGAAGAGMGGSTMKRKIIKSSMKGSNKSFVFQDNERASIKIALRPPATTVLPTRPSALPTRPSALPTRPTATALPRKRSLTSDDADSTRSKRTRFGDATLQPRAARTRAATAQPRVKPPSPKKPSLTPRTALPDFAALHRRRFAQMESLDECQQRKANRAKQLLTPNRCTNKAEQQKSTKAVATTTVTPSVPSSGGGGAGGGGAAPHPPYTLASLRPGGFTRFGFKINSDVSLFSAPTNTDSNARDARHTLEDKNIHKMHFSTGKMVKKTVEKVKPNVRVLPIVRVQQQPSSTGTTVNWKERARQTVMRERDNTSCKREQSRSEARVVIKGVRTNRRFELQMQMRNIH